MPVITFVNEGKRIEVPPGTNLRKIALKSGASPYKGIDKVINCRGFMLCGTCVVELTDGKGINPRSSEEEAKLRQWYLPFISRKVPPSYRLSCQVTVNGDIIVRTRPVFELDKEETKTRLTLLGIYGVFGLIFLGMFVLMFLDLIKLF